MAQFVSDTFTDTDGTTLTSHTGETGATWTLQTGFSQTWEVQSNAIRSSAVGAAGTQYYASGSPAGGNYEVSSNFVIIGSPTVESIGVTGRINTASNTGYFANYSLAAAGWRLLRQDGTSTFVQLGSTVSESLSAGTHSIKLRMSSSTIELYKQGEGTAAISQTDSTYSAAGKSGYRMSANNTANRIEMDNFSADDIVTSAGPIIKHFRLINGGILMQSRLVIRSILRWLRGGSFA